MSRLWFFKFALRMSGLKYPMDISTLLAIVGLASGVAALLVSLTLVDGYERSLKQSLFNVFSHVVVSPAQPSGTSLSDFRADLEKANLKVLGLSQFLQDEGLLASEGKVLGVSIEGVDPVTLGKVTSLKDRIVDGNFVLEPEGDAPQALFGKGIIERFNLKIGDKVILVIPGVSTAGNQSFSRKVIKLKVGGSLDFGKHFYNKRKIIAHRKVVADFAGVPDDFFSGVRVKLPRAEDAESFRDKVRDIYGTKYWIQSWKDVSSSLLEAIFYERLVIFFIVLILVVVASFNVSTNLYLNLIKRSSDISVLSTLGMSRGALLRLFILNGVIVATVGVIFGLMLAFVVVQLVNYILVHGIFVPPEVYKLSSIELQISVLEVLIVFAVSIFICGIASFVPARTLERFSVIKGLRYD